MIEVNIGDLCDRGWITLQTGPFGSQLHAYDYKPAGTPVVPTEAIGHRILYVSDLPQVGSEVVERLARHKLKAGDILFARRGVQATGYSALVKKEHEGWLCGTGAIRLRVHSDQIDPVFLSFLLSSSASISWFKAHAVGAVMPNLNEDVIRLFHLRLPSLSIQRAIAHILGTLDDKIELNRQMNATLEEMTRAIFKSWFVDFDPVHTKAAGRQPAGMDEATAALFPDSFESIEGREVPQGWKIAYLNEIATFVKGLSYRSSDLRESKMALITLKSIERGGGYKEEGLKPYDGDYKSEQQVLPGEVVVALTDLTQAAEVLGRPAMVRSHSSYDTLIASLDLMIVRPSVKWMSSRFLYSLLEQEDFREHTYGYANGTTVLHLSTHALPEYQFVLPSPQIIIDFDKTVKPIYQLLNRNYEQSNTLADLRDTLLPKLLSGELRVRDAERWVETVV